MLNYSDGYQYLQVEHEDKHDQAFKPIILSQAKL